MANTFIYSTAVPSTTLTTTTRNSTSLSFNSNLSFLSLSSTNSSSPISLNTLAAAAAAAAATTTPSSVRAKSVSCSASKSTAAATTTSKSFHGTCYVLGDNIDTDQIIPAEYLTLVPSKRDEYEKLGSYALCGLPAAYSTRFVEPGENKTKFSIIIAGANFGCGSSREHAPVALGAAGVEAVVAESYARIFFRNSVSTGEVYPLESEGRICDEFSTGNLVTVEMGEEENKLINHSTGKEYILKPIGDAGPVIDAGGIFAYARKSGMLPA